MTDTLVVTIFGSFISLLLMVNAYFTRETLIRLVKIEIKLENNSTKQSYIEKQAEENRREIHLIRERQHKAEGSQVTVLKYLDELIKGESA